MKKSFLILQILYLFSTLCYSQDSVNISFFKELLKSTPQIENLERILSTGFNINQTDSSGNTPLIIVSQKENTGLVKMFLDIGADPNITNSLGNTALHEAVKTGNIETCRLLLNSDTDKKSKNKEGYTPLDLAKVEGFIKIEELLLGEKNEHDFATLYVLRPSSVASFVPFNVYINGKFISKNRGNSGFKTLIPEGEYTITSHAENIAELKLKTKKGETYYILQSAKMGKIGTANRIELLSEKEGGKKIRKCKFIAKH